MKIMKDKKPAYVKGAEILLELPKSYYIAAFLKTYKFLLKNLEDCF